MKVELGDLVIADNKICLCYNYWGLHDIIGCSHKLNDRKLSFHGLHDPHDGHKRHQNDNGYYYYPCDYSLYNPKPAIEPLSFYEKERMHPKSIRSRKK